MCAQGGIRGELATVRKARQAKIEEKKAIRASMGGGRIDVVRLQFCRSGKFVAGGRVANEVRYGFAI